jgi:REP element-mobilizing transposase RayT
MMIAIPPKHAVSSVVGYIKGKNAIHNAQRYAERKRNFVGQHIWAPGYFVSTQRAKKIAAAIGLTIDHGFGRSSPSGRADGALV